MNAEREPQLPVLVADDDEALRRLYVRALGRAGIATLEAADGYEALRTVEREPIALLLLDIHMPGVDGVSIVEQLRAVERTSTLPVILVTGTADVPDRVRGLQAGADDYVLKSTHVSELVARVQARLRARTAWSDALGRELASRARMVSGLAGVPPGETIEETAAALVERLSTHAGVAFVSLLAADTEGGLTPLAGWKAGFGTWRDGPQLSPASSGHLLGRAAEGPWTESGGDTQSAHTGRFSFREVGTVCFAPLRQDGDLLGLLVMASEPQVTASASGDLLAATIDFAAVATAVLGGPLLRRRSERRDRHGIERLISEAAFSPVFQPLVRLDDRTVVGYEALTRFADGTRPDLRFREAGRLGLAQRLEEATIGEIVRVARALPAELPLGINVTPALALEPGWLADLAGRAHQRRLVVELTEHAEIEDYEPLRRGLASLGPNVAVAVDDAGAGYASLRHILELRPRYVKLDMALVRGIDADPARQSLVTGLAHCVSALGGSIIAEGVETEAEAEALLRLDIEFAQGWLYGRPEPVERWVGAPLQSA
jgi:EAL domain-containing protein (putative c-di-GMP-specific phosphodiesterase class I)/DNA-binding response OmpR family regulator